MLYAKVFNAVAQGAACAVPGIEVIDTIKVVDSTGTVVSTPDRASMRAVQTAQSFRAHILRDTRAPQGVSTDNAMLVESMGQRVVVIVGHADNRKITVPADLEWARAKVGQL